MTDGDDNQVAGMQTLSKYASGVERSVAKSKRVEMNVGRGEAKDKSKDWHAE